MHGNTVDRMGRPGSPRRAGACMSRPPFCGRSTTPSTTFFNGPALAIVSGSSGHPGALRMALPQPLPPSLFHPHNGPPNTYPAHSPVLVRHVRLVVALYIHITAGTQSMRKVAATSSSLSVASPHSTGTRVQTPRLCSLRLVGCSMYEYPTRKRTYGDAGELPLGRLTKGILSKKASSQCCSARQNSRLAFPSLPSPSRVHYVVGRRRD